VRASFWFLGILLLASAILGCIAYPLYLLVSVAHVWPFHRYYSRLAMLVVAALLVWLFRHLNVRTKRDFGYGLARRKFLIQCLIWAGTGICSAALGAAFICGAGLRVADPQFTATFWNLARIVAVGIGSGIAVALFEETLARGAMHTAIERESGPWAAALVTAALFAVLHFFAKASIPADQLAWRSGFDLLARSFAPLIHPSLVYDSLLAYFAIGLVLSLTRVLSGNIACAIGLHSGWVIVLRIMQQSTVRSASGDYAIWLGTFDGLVGLWMLPWAAALGLALWLTRKYWGPAARGQ
jgi:membrane protease YdiL (CAAX protease family)